MYIGRQNSVVRVEQPIGTCMASPEGVGREPLGLATQGQLACAATRPRGAHSGDGTGGRCHCVLARRAASFGAPTRERADRWAGQPERGWSAAGGCDRPPRLLRRSRQQQSGRICGLRGLHCGARREDVARAGCRWPSRSAASRSHGCRPALAGHRRVDRDHGESRSPCLAAAKLGWLPNPTSRLEGRCRLP